MGYSVKNLVIENVKKLFNLPAFFLVLGFALMVAATTSCFYKENGRGHSVLHNDDSTVDECFGTDTCVDGNPVEGECAGEYCMAMQTFAILAMLLSGIAIFTTFLPEVELVQYLRLVDTMASTSAFAGASFLTSLIFIMIALLGLPNGATVNLADKANSGQPVELCAGFHCAWAAVMSFFIALISSACAVGDMTRYMDIPLR